MEQENVKKNFWGENFYNFSNGAKLTKYENYE